MSDLLVLPDNLAIWRGMPLRCAIGRGGRLPAAEKREGDGATPIGAWPMRELLYRADRVTLPIVSPLPSRALARDDGWCDAPLDPLYNQPVHHPYPASAERLWREDAVYDLIVPLGYNDEPIIAGHGSAIFLHCATPDYEPTAGCVALSHADMLLVLQTATIESCVRIIG
jgi:L,D-peptidoglycan transpeptidase YkuD (ErfK/YbiS/YcfS/YnhG family)